MKSIRFFVKVYQKRGGDSRMCYNCGCRLPKDDMGKGVLHKGGGSLVEEDFEHMAKGWGMSVEDTKKEVYKLLKTQVEKEDKETS